MGNAQRFPMGRSPRLFHRLSPPRCFRQWRSLGVETAHDVRTVAHAEGAVQVLVHGHPATGQSVPPRRLFDLQQASNLHGIVPIHHTLMLESKDIV